MQKLLDNIKNISYKLDTQYSILIKEKESIRKSIKKLSKSKKTQKIEEELIALKMQKIQINEELEEFSKDAKILNDRTRAIVALKGAYPNTSMYQSNNNINPVDAINCKTWVN